MLQHGAKLFVYTCSFKKDTSESFVSRTENLVFFSGAVSMAWTGCYFWFLWFNYQTEISLEDQIIYYCYYQLSTLMVAFVISLVLPPAPYADSIAQGKLIEKTPIKRLQEHLLNSNRVAYVKESCTNRCSAVLSQVLSFRMIKFLPHIAVTASLTAIYESVVYTFLFNNTVDKLPDKDPFAVPFLVMIAYYFSMFIFSIGQCKKCFEHSAYQGRGTKVCGALANFLILGIVLGLIVVGSLADNNLIVTDWSPLFKNFSLYVIAGLALGITQVIMRRQRKSLTLENYDTWSGFRADLALLDATGLMEDLMVLIYQSVIVNILCTLK